MNLQRWTWVPDCGSQGIQGLALLAFQAKLEKNADPTVITSVQLSSLHPFLTSFFLPNEGDKRKEKKIM